MVFIKPCDFLCSFLEHLTTDCDKKSVSYAKETELRNKQSP